MIRMLGCSAVIAALVFTVPALAADDPNYHELPLQLGSSGKLKQIITLTKTKAGETTVTGGTTSEYVVAYTATDEGYLVKKTLRSIDTKALETTPDQAALLEGLAGRFSTISYTANDSLAPLRLEEFDAFKANLNATFKDILKLGKPLKPEETARIETVLQSMFGNLTPESASELFLPTDTMMSIPRNVGLTLNSPLIGETEIQSPLGGPPIAARENLTLTKWDETKKQAHVTYTFTPEPASLKAYIKDFLPGFMKTAGAPDSAIAEFNAEIAKGATSDVLTMTTICDYDMAIETGLIDKGVCTRTTSFTLGGKTQGKIERHDFSETRID